MPLVSDSSWRSPTVGGLTAALFATYLIALPPHLVHHLFDEDQGRPECPLLAQSQQNPELQPDPPILPLPSRTDTVELLLPEASPRAPNLPLKHPRAPPRSAPSA